MQNLRKEARFPYAGTKNLLLFLWSTLVYLSMKYRVNGIEIPLDRKETAAAKRMVAKFMEEVEKNSKDTGNIFLAFLFFNVCKFWFSIFGVHCIILNIIGNSS